MENESGEGILEVVVKPAPQAPDAALQLRSERLRALRSAWGTLAPSGLSAEKQRVAESGRALAEELTALASDEPGDDASAALAALDARIDELEREMRDVALRIPVAQLRSTLPERLAVDRRGVLDLLDLILGAELEGLDGIGGRIPSLDYLITILCTGGNPAAPLQDPVNLTPRLHELCMRSDVEYDPRLPELEAAFFQAADLHEADVREEVELRTLRRRKMELGHSFFAPRVLRAIMTYNAALLRRIDEEVLRSQDWGVLPQTRTEAPSGGGSPFECAALPRLAAALRRRAADEAPAFDALDRIAWCLDLAYLTESERRELLSETTGRPEGLLGTVILLGLLRRSSVVLDEEFPAIGIAPEAISGAWTRELDHLLQQEVNRRIASDGYDAACALSELKGRFLSTSASAPRSARVRSAPPPRRSEERPVPSRRRAEQLVHEALEDRSRPERRSLGQLPWARIARSATAGIVGVAALAVAVGVFLKPGRVPRGELAQVSPYLASGQRSGDGLGSAFVGRLSDDWSPLSGAEQLRAAETLVEALRERGIRDVMVYDDGGRLRIQALGASSPRVIPATPEG